MARHAGYTRPMVDLAFSMSSGAVAWPQIKAEVHAWPGEMVQCFARAELEIGEVLHAAGQGGGRLHLASQKTSALSQIVAKGAAHAAVGANVRGELDCFAEFNPLRSTLTHGYISIAVDEAGDWVAIFRLLAFTTARTDYEVAAFSRQEAATLKERLESQVGRLVGQLRAMKRKLTDDR